jgi:hypothetical protein
MPDNENPVLNEDRASRVSFADWTPEVSTIATYRAQYLINAYRVRPELATVLETAVFGETRYG